MTASPTTLDWHQANQQYFLQAIAQVRYALEQKAGQSAAAVPPEPDWRLAEPPALDRLCQQFGLSAFERQILLLCAGVEISRAIAALCAAIHGDAQRPHPTFGLALSLFTTVHWGALTPQAPLRRWRLVEVATGAELTHSPLRIDERILHYLMGVEAQDGRLMGVLSPAQPADFNPDLPPSHQRIVQQIVAVGLGDQQPGIVQLCGQDSGTKRAIAVAACAQANLALEVIAAETLPIDHHPALLIQCLCERESMLHASALLLDCDAITATATGGDGSPAQLNGVITRFSETTTRPLLIMSRDRRIQRQRPLINFEINAPTPDEQRQIWHRALGETAPQLNGQVDRLVTYFNFSFPDIHATCHRVRRLSSEADSLGDLLWQACLIQSRPRLEDLAQPIRSTATWDDLVLPDKEKQVLQTIAAHVRQRAKVYDQWGFGEKSQRGLGISALFAGNSGTGKTLAAEVIAHELQLDLYRIDLSSVVSKYIGETEKNLRRIFDAAETGGAILLFDEADALFGKRSEVKDSHDRYANMEVAYLLQRIEAYRGLAILTTNLKDSLDQAFLRRIRFVVQFPFPDASQREDIWQRVFPAQTPTQDLAYSRLAKLNVSGGNIRNIALNAAFLAADAAEPVQMTHILQAAQSEYIKLERPLTDREIKGWLPKED